MGIKHQIQRVCAQKSASVRTDAPNQKADGQSALNAIGEGAQFPHAGTIPKPKGGRPSTGFDKKAYMSAFMRDKRKADKLGLKVSEYRKLKGEDK